MQTLSLLAIQPESTSAWPPVVAGVAIACMCSTLSVLVVLKRMSFVGQGISHAAFGAVGLTAVLAAAGFGFGTLGTEVMILFFSILAAVVIAFITAKGEKATIKADTAIGIVLAATMAAGFLLVHQAEVMAEATGGEMPREIEDVLFGSMSDVGWGSAGLAWTGTVAVLIAMYANRKSLLFWAFDEPAAEAFGVPTGKMRTLLMVLLAVAVVTTMRLAGVVLATAMLVLPGATALALSNKFSRVLVASLVAALTGILAGIMLSMQLNIQIGPAIVVAQCTIFGLAKAFKALAAKPTTLPS